MPGDETDLGEVIDIFKISISDPKEGKSWQVEKEATPLIGTKIGEEFNGSLIGLEGYTLEVTGGSDEDGFPMRRGIRGSGRRRVLMKKGPGYRPKEDGVRTRKSVRGEQISDEVVQVNTKVVERESDAESIPELLGIGGSDGEETEEDQSDKEE